MNTRFSNSLTITFDLACSMISTPKDNDKIVVFDTPFVRTDQLAHQRQLWLSCLSQHFDILLIPHPRSNKLRTSTSIAKSNATLYDLLNNYTYFVGIWSTISIDMSWHHKVYITCPYLRPPGYSIIDEDIGATLTALSNHELISLLRKKPLPPFSQQNSLSNIYFRTHLILISTFNHLSLVQISY